MSRSFTASSKYPTLRQVLFSPHTPYVPPRDSPLAMSVWRWRIWFESTFGLVSMEPWEKYTVVAFFLLVFGCMVHAGLAAHRTLSTAIFGFNPELPSAHDTSALRNSTFRAS